MSGLVPTLTLVGLFPGCGQDGLTDVDVTVVVPSTADEVFVSFKVGVVVPLLE